MSKPKYGEDRLKELIVRLNEGDTFRPAKEGVSKCCYRRLKCKRSSLGLWYLSLAVYWDIMETYDPKDGGAYPSRETLAKENRVSEKAIKLALDQLEENHLIEKIEGGGRGNANHYVILWHPIFKIPISEIKGEVGLPLSENKRGSRRSERGNQNDVKGEVEGDKGGSDFLNSSSNNHDLKKEGILGFNREDRGLGNPPLISQPKPPGGTPPSTPRQEVEIEPTQQ